MHSVVVSELEVDEWFVVFFENWTKFDNMLGRLSILIEFMSKYFDWCIRVDIRWLVESNFVANDYLISIDFIKCHCRLDSRKVKISSSLSDIESSMLRIESTHEIIVSFERILFYLLIITKWYMELFLFLAFFQTNKFWTDPSLSNFMINFTEVLSEKDCRLSNTNNQPLHNLFQI